MEVQSLCTQKIAMKSGAAQAAPSPAAMSGAHKHAADLDWHLTNLLSDESIQTRTGGSCSQPPLMSQCAAYSVYDSHLPTRMRTRM